MKTIDKKAFFFDYDGTIWFGSYGEKTLKALKELHSNGHLLFLNSGRSRGNTRPDKLALIPFDGIICGGNHAEVFGKELFRRDITKEVLEEVIRLEKEYDLWIIYEGVRSVYRRKGILPEDRSEELEDVTCLLDCDKYPITKFSIIKKGEDGKRQPIPNTVIKELEKYFDVVELGHYYECMLIGTGKDVAAKKVVESLGIDPRSVYVFGDSLNDLAMFKAFNHRVAIGHSPRELKKIAEYVTVEELNGAWEALVHLGFVNP